MRRIVMLDYQFNHKLNYIDWYHEAKRINVSHEEFNKKLEELKLKRKVSKSKTIRTEWMTGKVYSVDKRGNWMQLYWNDPKSHTYYVWCSNPYQASGDQPDRLGTKSMRIFAAEFARRHGDFTLKQIFGYSPEEVKKCIPKQFYYVNSMWQGRKLKGISCIDGTSQFLSNARGVLPDWGTAKEQAGTFKPTEEYPFAYYLKSGHIAEFGKFDTHEWPIKYPDWFEYVMAYDRYFPCKPEEDVTVLCKPAKYELTEVLEYFYKRRSIDPDAKGIVNRTIGFMHKSNYNSFKLAHIAALTIARSNDQMLQMVKKIGTDDVLHVAVDGIIYWGRKQYGQENKEMGKFYQEFVNCTGEIAQANCYIIQDEDGRFIKEKHSGFNIRKDGKEIKLEEIESLDDWKNWKKVDPLKNSELIFKGRSYINGNEED